MSHWGSRTGDRPTPVVNWHAVPLPDWLSSKPSVPAGAVAPDQPDARTECVKAAAVVPMPPW